MSDKTLKDLTVDAHIAVLHTKVDSLIEKQKELTERVRANEKVVAALGVLGTIAIAFIGAGAFAPKAEAREQEKWDTGSVIQKMRDWKSAQGRPSVEDMINASLLEYSEHTEEEE